MTVELAIENDLVKTLQESIRDCQIETFSGDLDDVLKRAKRHSKGLIVVAHSYDSADYQGVTRNVCSMTIPYSINILSNDRKGSAGVMELLDKTRNCLFEYSFYNYPAKLTSHLIDPTRSPDLDTGVFRAELSLEIRVNLFDLQNKLRVN